jgi:adenosylhomocysteine nucleosidase
MPELKLFGENHFTVSEQGQLKNRLSRWAALTDAQVPEFDKDLLPKGKDVLGWLDQQISQIEFFVTIVFSR